MRQYADSSFLVSCYLRDANTAQAILLVTSTSPTIVFTPLHELEVRNALQLQVFRKALSQSEAKRVWRVLMQDIKRRRLIVRDVKWPIVFRNASRLSQSHTQASGTRSLDILHVAAAKHLRAKVFLSFDLRQRALATAAGLVVKP